jgi:hypothetical protein
MKTIVLSALCILCAGVINSQGQQVVTVEPGKQLVIRGAPVTTTTVQQGTAMQTVQVPVVPTGGGGSVGVYRSKGSPKPGSPNGLPLFAPVYAPPGMVQAQGAPRVAARLTSNSGVFNDASDSTYLVRKRGLIARLFVGDKVERVSGPNFVQPAGPQ